MAYVTGRARKFVDLLIRSRLRVPDAMTSLVPEVRGRDAGGEGEGEWEWRT